MFPPPSRTSAELSGDVRCPACGLLIEFPIWSCDRCATRFHSGCVRPHQSGCAACASPRGRSDRVVAIVTGAILIVLVLLAKWIGS